MGSMSEVCVCACACVYRSPRPPPLVVCLIKNKVFVLGVVGTQMEPRFAAGALKREALVFISGNLVSGMN